jgi:hypothetical protein
MKDVLVIIYGVFGRSFKYTNINHRGKILQTLKNADISYDICYVNNDIGDIPIDGVVVDNHYYREGEHDSNVTVKQSDVDRIINNMFRDKLWRLFTGNHYTDQIKINALRNSYIESTVSRFIKCNINKYRYAVAFCVDCYFEKNIDPKWLDDTAVTVSDQNPGAGKWGYTNGFYVGDVCSVSRLLDSFENLPTIGSFLDYEGSIKRLSIYNNITVAPVSFKFLKIRADGREAYGWVEHENLRLKFISEQQKSQSRLNHQ